MSREGTVGGHGPGADTADFYRFRVSSTGQTELRLTGLSRDIDIQLLDADGNMITQGVRSGTTSEWITANLVAGRDYFVRVHPYGEGPVSGYRLSVTRTPADPNGTMANASNLGVINGSRSFGGTIGGTDANDYLRFRAANSGRTSFDLSNLSRDVDMQILDANGNVIASETRGGTANESLAVNLVAGREYFVRIHPYGNGPVSGYRLNIDNTPADPNGTMATATNVGVIRGVRSFRGTIGGDDMRDYVRFRVASTGWTQVSLSRLSRNVDLELLDSSGQVIARSHSAGNASEMIGMRMYAGRDYFLRISPNGFGGITSFDLSIRNSSS